jgi:transposase InsO family protein
MRRNWIGAGVLVGLSIMSGLFLSQMWEHVLGQPVGFSVEAPQIVVNQPAVLPKWCVDFVSLPQQQGGRPPEVRVITVVDTESKKIVVYHLNITTGALQLLSVRDIQPDLMINQFNATSPLPSEIMREVQRFGGRN